MRDGDQPMSPVANTHLASRWDRRHARSHWQNAPESPSNDAGAASGVRRSPSSADTRAHGRHPPRRRLRAREILEARERRGHLDADLDVDRAVEIDRDQTAGTIDAARLGPVPDVPARGGNDDRQLPSFPRRLRVMIGFSRLRTLLACAALLALSAGWNFGARPELAAQSAAADGTLDPALVSAFKWRSVGPDRGGRSIAVSGVKGRAEGGLLRRGRRRPLEDDRRRREVGAGHRRPDHELVGRRRRRLRIEPRRRLHRDGRGVHPRQHHGRRRRLQVDRRRQDLDPRRLQRLRRDLEDPHPPDQPRHRLRRRLRPLRQGQRRARRLQEHRRRQELEEGAVPQRQDRRGRRRRSIARTRA